MEKLVYLLLGRAGPVQPDVGRALRDGTVPALRRSGAYGIQVNVADAELGHPFGVEPDPDSEQILAAVSLWLARAGGNEGMAAVPDPGDSGAAWHGWLVCESEPIVTRAHPPGPDGRVP